MNKKHWYILSYDIRHEKRLKKFHYRLKKRALALQKSVFLIEANEAEIQQIITLVQQHTHTHEDDVRLYPISQPQAIWGAGIQHQAFTGLDIAKATTVTKKSGFKHFIQQFWRTKE